MYRLRWCAVAIALCSSSAWAQAPAPASYRAPESPATAPAAPTAPAVTAASAPPPDVVVLKNGNRYRGTIAELVKEGTLTIVLITGETRRLDAKDVSYAGPAESEPRVPAAAPVAAGAATEENPAARAKAGELQELQRVRFSSSLKGTGFFYSVEGGYKRICAAPCARNLPTGTYDFGIKRPEDEHVLRMRDVLIDQPTSLSAEVHSRSGVRSAGRGVLTVSLLVLGLSALYLSQGDDPNALVAVPFVVSGVAGSIVGLSLAFVGDKVSLSVSQHP